MFCFNKMGFEGIYRIGEVIFVVVPYSVLVQTHRYHSKCKMMKALNFNYIKQRTELFQKQKRLSSLSVFMTD